MYKTFVHVVPGGVHVGGGGANVGGGVTLFGVVVVPVQRVVVLAH